MKRLVQFNNSRAKRGIPTLCRDVALALATVTVASPTASAVGTHALSSAITSVKTGVQPMTCQPAIGDTYVHAIARQADGTVMRGRDLYLYLHKVVKPLVLHPIASAHSGPGGGVTWRVHHNSALADYAVHHHGMLNLEAINYRFSPHHKFARTVTFRYCTTSRYLGLIHLAYTANTVVRGGKAGNPQPDLYPPSEFGGSTIAQVPVVHVEGAKGVTTSVNFSSDSSVSVTAGAGMSGTNWAFSGSLTVNGTHSSITGDEWALGHAVGVVYTRAVQFDRQRECTYYNPGYYAAICSFVTTASFVGNDDVGPQRVRYNTCQYANPNYVIRWGRRQVLHMFPYRKDAGHSLTAALNVSAFDWNISASTTWGSGTSQIYDFHKSGSDVNNYYCIAGIGGPWDTITSWRLVAGSSVHRVT